MKRKQKISTQRGHLRVILFHSFRFKVVDLMDFLLYESIDGTLNLMNV